MKKIFLQKYPFLKKTFFGFFLVVFVSGLFFVGLNVSFYSQREKKIFIPTGTSLKQISRLLKEEELILSPFFFQFFTQLRGDDLKSGHYLIQKGTTLIPLEQRLAKASYGNVYEKLTFPEGATNEQMVKILMKSPFPLDEQKLRSLMEGKEGSLFPETYVFLPDANEELIIKKMEETFAQKLEKALRGKKVEASPEEIVTMASLIEKEASQNLREKQIISGILWKRIRKGMPLQVDAPFLYERGKGSAQLSRKDLQESSRYNTYTQKGLPPTAIGNPGYDALYAAAHPIETDYLFYLHGRDGNIHYAKSYREHLLNKRKYLD